MKTLFIIIIFSNILLLLFSCNILYDIHHMSDGRSDNYKQRKCFVECLEKKALLAPESNQSKYIDICIQWYALGCD